MPIYEYRCANCGFQKEYLQKVSDAPLTVCPECNQATFGKMVTAAGFQLKGTGWYVTDFRNGSAPAKKADESKSADAAKDAGAAKPEGAKSDGKSDAAAPAPAPAPAPASSAPSGPSTTS